MQTYIKVKSGNYRNNAVAGKIFPLVKQFQVGVKGGAVTVLNNGIFSGYPDQIKIKVSSPADYEFVDEVAYLAQGSTPPEVAKQEAGTSNETDEEIMERLGKRFEILHEMTRAAINGDIRAMIVTGPPGVGKSFGVELECEKASLFDRIANRKLKYEVIKGASTPIGLYCTLFKYKDPGSVLVFDDCDTVLLDDLSLNILKAALDSGKRRKISWNSDSKMLRREDVPAQFEFRGSIIFITNLNFDNLRSAKLKDHLEALQSRCHFLDLSISTMRDKFLRIKQIAKTGELFKEYDLGTDKEDELLDFMYTNRNRLREMSLRMALKIADLTKVSSNWKSLAETTCMKGA